MTEIRSSSGARSRPRLVVGLGTGRCGTRSLAELLGRQHGTSSHHQPDPCLPWAVDPGWYHHARELVAGDANPVVALVAWYYLTYVDLFLRDHDARFVCLRRDRSATVHSIARLTEGFDNWSSRPARDSVSTQFRHLFPKYDVQDKLVALGRYYDEYYSIAESLQADHPDRFRIFSTEDLNDRGAVTELLRFAGYDDPVVVSGVHEGRMERYEWRAERWDSEERSAR